MRLLKNNLKEFNCDDDIDKGKYIYFAFYNNKIIYIGKSENIKKRLNAHHSGKRSVVNFVYIFLTNMYLMKNYQIS